MGLQTSGFTEVDPNKRWCWASPFRFVFFFPAVFLGGIGAVAPIGSTAKWTLAGIGFLLFLVVLFDALYNAKSRFKFKKAPVDLEKAPLTSQQYGVNYMPEVPTALVAPDPSAHTFQQYPPGVPTALVAPDPSAHTFQQYQVAYPATGV
jgi:hypothetical protein